MQKDYKQVTPSHDLIKECWSPGIGQSRPCKNFQVSGNVFDLFLGIRDCHIGSQHGIC